MTAIHSVVFSAGPAFLPYVPSSQPPRQGRSIALGQAPSHPRGHAVACRLRAPTYVVGELRMEPM